METSELAGRPDYELLRAVADGDTGALRVLYDRHSPWLTVRLVRRCNDRDLVAEVLQDTFVAVWQGAGRFRGEGNALDRGHHRMRRGHVRVLS
jgi:RNA polymerase sigma-70 factor (ECF subfamily)